MPAALIWSGVSKSGSPAPSPMMSRPAAFSSAARVVTAMVGDGELRVIGTGEVAQRDLHADRQPRVRQSLAKTRDAVSTEIRASLFDVLAGHPHVAVLEGAPQAIVDHRIDQLTVAHSQPLADAGAPHAGDGRGAAAVVARREPDALERLLRECLVGEVGEGVGAGRRRPETVSTARRYSIPGPLWGRSPPSRLAFGRPGRNRRLRPAAPPSGVWQRRGQRSVGTAVEKPGSAGPRPI